MSNNELPQLPEKLIELKQQHQLKRIPGGRYQIFYLPFPSHPHGHHVGSGIHQTPGKDPSRPTILAIKPPKAA